MISKKCEYALRAVLALSRQAGSRPMTIHQIAQAESIPERFLEAILRDLKQSGLTESIRGKDGGYKLTRAPADITAGDVVRAVDGRWLQEEGLDETDVFTSLWRGADQALFTILDAQDFQTLVSKQDALTGTGIHNYTI
jgi:Rrf2 family cysteine metabolism transcriptional repressor